MSTEKGLTSNLSVPFCWSYIETPVSGSPIVQNGKLVGAVTHVLVDDPTRGYGIFAENMLDTADTAAELESAA